MPQAQSKELDTDYGRLQQTYSRLSAEHASVTNQQKRNFQLFKEQKANEISSLEGRNVRILTPVDFNNKEDIGFWNYNKKLIMTISINVVVHVR